MVNRLTCLFVYNRKLLPLVYLVIAMKLSMVRIWWTLLECRKWKQASSMAIARCILWLVLDLYIPKWESKQPTNSMHNKFCWCRRNNNNKKLLKDNITRRVLLCIVFVFLFCLWIVLVFEQPQQIVRGFVCWEHSTNIGPFKRPREWMCATFRLDSRRISYQNTWFRFKTNFFSFLIIYFTVEHCFPFVIFHHFTLSLFHTRRGWRPTIISL